MRLPISSKRTRLGLDCYSPLAMCVHRVKQAASCLVNFGPAFTAKKIGSFIEKRTIGRRNDARWIAKHADTPEQLDEQRARSSEMGIRFSVVVPLFNTPEPFLQEMLQSVLDQTYGHWELCLADSSDAEHGGVERICRDLARRDARVRYRRTAEGGGISATTNACLEMAAGDYIALLDHDDALAPSALFKVAERIADTDADVVYTDEAIFHGVGTREVLFIHFKPDFGIDSLRANNYLCHFTAYRRSLLRAVGTYRSECDGSQDHDMMLRLAAVTRKFEHVPEVLYYWRAHLRSAAFSAEAKPLAAAAGRRAVLDSLHAAGLEAHVESTPGASTIYRVRYELAGHPLVSIVIPSCNHVGLLRKCLESIQKKTTYPNYEIIVVENNSTEAETFGYYREAQRKWSNVKVLCWHGPWNWAAINNFGLREAAAGSHYLLLNNDTEVVAPGWIEEMLMYAQRDDVGAVGAKLLFSNKKIQHAGVIIDPGAKNASHVFYRSQHQDSGYMGRLTYAQNMSAVTGACLMVPKDVFDEVGGIDEQFAVGFNDIDLCLRIRKAGYLVVWTPHAVLYHYQSQSRGIDDTPRKMARNEQERSLFEQRWSADYAQGDPYYSIHLRICESGKKSRELRPT